MKNIFLLPTYQPSRLRYNLSNVLVFTNESYRDYGQEVNQNIYITSDEEIKEDDWGLSKLNEVILFGRSYNEKFYKKIILTTDQELIKDGVQAIDDTFLEWFVENPTCEFVKTELLNVSEVLWEEYFKKHGVYPKYPYYEKIIIPQEEPKQELLPDFKITKNIFDFVTDLSDTNKEEPNPLDNLEERFKRDMSMIVMPLDNENIPEEPKQKFSRKWKELKGAKPSEPLKSWVDESEEETLEKAATNYSHDWENITGLDSNDVSPFGASIVDFKSGANWQAERMYSEEEVLDLLYKRDLYLFNRDETKELELPNDWFEQHKKK
jgi:hypothetical protein